VKNIAEFAEGVLQDTRGASGHTDADWSTLAEASTTTLAWSAELAKIWGEGIYGSPHTQAVVEKLNRGDHEQSFAVWYERIVSGEPGQAFWAETCLIGLYHASAGVNNRHVIGMASKVECEFLGRCLDAFEREQALNVYGSFKRVFSLATALMVDSYLHAIMLGLTEIGMNERLVNRIRNVAIRRMIEQARSVLPLIDWSEALSVGIKVIDDQHKKLVDLLNGLHDSRAQGAGNEVLKKILNDLTNYTVEHFGFEEQLMQKHGYPDFPNHKKAHDALTSQVAALNDEFQAGNAKLSGDLFKFLRRWLNGHIRGTDKLYSEHLRDHGVQ
jgi:hemerythrin